MIEGENGGPCWIETANRLCSKVLGIDEHFFTRKRGYATTLVDLKRKIGASGVRATLYARWLPLRRDVVDKLLHIQGAEASRNIVAGACRVSTYTGVTLHDVIENGGIGGPSIGGHEIVEVALERTDSLGAGR